MRSKGAPGHVVELEHIGFDQLELSAPLRAEIGKRLGAELAIDLDAGDAALRSDAVGHQPHHRAWA